MTTLELRPARPADLDAIIGLLDASALPSCDLTTDKLLGFVTATVGVQLVGVAGIEPMGCAGLIRSLAVAPAHRGSGIGQRLVAQCEADAREAEIEALYLLTTSADAYLRRLGYVAVPRSDVPEDVAGHAQFKGMCPASAKCLMKSLSEP